MAVMSELRKKMQMLLRRKYNYKTTALKNGVTLRKEFASIIDSNDLTGYINYIDMEVDISKGNDIKLTLRKYEENRKTLVFNKIESYVISITLEELETICKICKDIV